MDWKDFCNLFQNCWPIELRQFKIRSAFWWNKMIAPIFWLFRSDLYQIGSISGVTDWQQTTLNRSPSPCPGSSQHSFRFSFFYDFLLIAPIGRQIWRKCKKMFFFYSNMIFQDDLFPPTRVLWQPSCSGARWLAGELGAALWVGLKINSGLSHAHDALWVLKRVL